MEIFDLKRFNDREKEIKDLYYKLYSKVNDVDLYYDLFLKNINKMYLSRSENLKSLDEERYNSSSWYMNNNMVGIMLYVDLFNKDLKGLKDKIEYLKSLGITYVHLMPLLKMPKVITMVGTQSLVTLLLMKNLGQWKSLKKLQVYLEKMV